MAGRITKDNDGGFILNLDGHRQLYKASYEGNLFVEEVLAKVYAWCCNTFAHQALDLSINAATRIQIGKRIEVVKAVKRAKDARNNVPKGMQGIVTQVQDTEFGVRVQFADDGIHNALPGERYKYHHWVSANNLEVVDPKQYFIEPEEAWAQGCAAAWTVINQKSFRSINYHPSSGVPFVG